MNDTEDKWREWGVKVAMVSFTDAHAHAKTQSRAFTLGSLLIVVYAKETEHRLLSE